MPLTCRECSHKNPREAVFCYFDGVPLEGGSGGDAASISISVQGFTSPFFLPSGVRCRSFRELACACLQDRNAAYDLIKDGFLEPFLVGQGRVDLAMAAREVVRAPDRERGLDEFLAKLPGVDLDPARLEVEPTEVHLGTVAVGEDRRFELVLHNRGERLLFGKVAADHCPWLAFGESGSPEKLFQFSERLVLPVQIRGQDLRAFGKPLRGEIILETNGGNSIVVVQVTVPVKAFPEGILAGALSPRELAEKAKAAPEVAAPLIVNGAVARWYAANGWPYPVQEPTAAGVAAVQQLFEALGLVKPPRVELSETKVELKGRPGDRIEYVIAVMTPEKRYVVAHAVANEPWLEVGATIFRGRTATIPLTIGSIPHEPGRKLYAEVKISANGNQRFTVPVTLAVTNDPAITPSFTPASPAPVVAFAAVPIVAAPSPAPIAAIALEPVALPVPQTDAPMATVVPLPVPPIAVSRGRWLPLVVRVFPVAVVVVGLLVAVARDLIVPEGPQPEPPPYPTDQTLDIRFHEPTMRFGLVMLKESDPKNPKKFKRLTYDEGGFTSNTCLMVGATSVLFGNPPGVFDEPKKKPLGKDPTTGRELIGYRTIWTYNRIEVTQQVEIVADAQLRALDTCRVTYTLHNNGDVRQIVGLRYMLDTYIGANDGVPFNIPGKGLCDSSHEFKKAEDVPDFVTALERDDVKNPGTVAHVTLKAGGGLEAPSRVILGAWPDSNLFAKSQLANKQDTLWEVPVLSMHDPALERPDSAVTMYWEPRELKSGDTRVVGFAYGLGEVSGDSGSLGLTLAGNSDSFVAGGEFSLTAYIKDPVEKQTATLTLGSKRLSLVDGKETQDVPKLDPNVKSTYSPVTWKIRSTRGGRFELKVTLSTGAKQSIPVNIYSTGLMEGAARKK